jgi:Rap1a immunity proteins
MRRAILVAVALCCLAFPLKAQEPDKWQPLYWFKGSDIHMACSAKAKPVNDIICRYYVIGVIEGLNYGRWKSEDPLFCPSQQVTGGQYIEIVRHYLRDHPERRYGNAVLLVVAALNEKFPCN